MTTLFYIYGLFDPLDEQIYYIGQTDSVEKRLESYVKYLDQKSNDTSKRNQATIAAGKTLSLKKLVVCDSREEAESLESLLIYFLMKKGVVLTNKQIKTSFVKHIQKHKTRYPRLHGAAWFVENESGLQHLHKLGLGTDELALVMRRTETAIRMKLDKLNSAEVS